jgi:hypothetical protein
VNRKLLILPLAGLALVGAAYAVFACGDKTSDASAAAAGKAKSNAATASYAGCSEHGASAAAAGGCPYHNSSAAMTASAGECSHGAATAAAEGSCAHGASAGKDDCAARGAGMAVIASAACAKGAMASGSCSAHKTTGAAYEAGVSHDCDACVDMMQCESQLKAAGSHIQVVPLKNGVMYVYTADNARNVRDVQVAVARRSERINALVAADHVRLCPDCKQMRGATASGKLNREVVNIEGGSICLVTSTDPGMVARLYSMAGVSTPKGLKS